MLLFRCRQDRPRTVAHSRRCVFLVRLTTSYFDLPLLLFLPPKASGAEPILTILAPEGVDLNGTYTVVLADPGAVGASTAEGVTRHMLVNGARVGGASPASFSLNFIPECRSIIANGTLDLSGGVSITRYAGPAPPEDGPHRYFFFSSSPQVHELNQTNSSLSRYTFLVYTQPENFAAPEGFSTPNMGVSAFDLNAYAQSAKLGPIIAVCRNNIYFVLMNIKANLHLTGKLLHRP